MLYTNKHGNMANYIDLIFRITDFLTLLYVMFSQVSGLCKFFQQHMKVCEADLESAGGGIEL